MNLAIKRDRINDFYRELNKQGFEKFEALINTFSIDFDTLLPFAKWSNQKYQRICLGKNENSELLLICWDNNQESAAHNHGGETCRVHFVKGSFKEIRYESDKGIKIIGETMIEPGLTTFLTDDIAFHKLSNRNDEKAMTLHLYTSPIKSCKVFDNTTDAYITREMSYDFLLEDFN